MSLRVAMLSVHTCPLAVLGGKETGGMNVYVRELSRELGRMGLAVDVFTRSQDPMIRRVVPLGDGARVVHLPAGPQAPMPREQIHDHLDEFVDGLEAWRIASGVEYELVHAHYWLSGVVGLSLRERWGVPLLQMFHTLGRFKNGAALRLLIVGGEADEPTEGHEAEIRQRVDQLGLRESVRFVGAQPQQALRDYYVAADVTVLPSYYESFGMVALEAMACGSPVIGSRVGGLATTVRDGVTGFLVPDGDAIALGERIEALVNDADLRFRLGREGVQWAARRRWPGVTEAICREYARLETRAEPHLAAARCHE